MQNLNEEMNGDGMILAGLSKEGRSPADACMNEMRRKLFTLFPFLIPLAGGGMVGSFLLILGGVRHF